MGADPLRFMIWLTRAYISDWNRLGLRASNIFSTLQQWFLENLPPLLAGSTFHFHDSTRLFKQEHIWWCKHTICEWIRIQNHQHPDFDLVMICVDSFNLELGGFMTCRGFRRCISFHYVDCLAHDALLAHSRQELVGFRSPFTGGRIRYHWHYGCVGIVPWKQPRSYCTMSRNQHIPQESWWEETEVVLTQRHWRTEYWISKAGFERYWCCWTLEP